MDNRQYQDCLHHHNAILYKITSQCNDDCPFCCEYEFIASGRPSLSLQEFIENYHYLTKRFTIDYVILTGGEPTLHPEIFDMLEFLKNSGIGYRIITNMQRWSDMGFAEHLSAYFKNFKNKDQAQKTKIIASINDPSDVSRSARTRIQGLKNALKLHIPLMITVVMYRHNLQYLKSLGLELKNIIRTEAPSGRFHIEFRLMYIQGTEEHLVENTVSEDMNTVVTAVKQLIPAVLDKKILLTFWNFPLCYLIDYKQVMNDTVRERQNRRLIKVSKNIQLENVEVRNWESFLKSHTACAACSLSGKCSGIEMAYINRYNYRALKGTYK